MYQHFSKRLIDFFFGLIGLIILSPLFLTLIILGAIFMRGNPFFTQARPGRYEKIFKLIKFRTMDNRKDGKGNLLPDEVRLNRYGKFLRASSLDELPEFINIIKGEMSFVGPRPQLVRDMVFMSDEQRKRHTVRPGLTGLAQVMGRNSISWEEKISFDLQYIENINLLSDMGIIFQTVVSVLQRKGITDGENATALDYGDSLLQEGRITKEEYNILQTKAKSLITVYEENHT